MPACMCMPGHWQGTCCGQPACRAAGTCRISIISRDTYLESRLCKVDVRTRGGQSYSFGEHCPGGLPQTLELYPGRAWPPVLPAGHHSGLV